MKTLLEYNDPRVILSAEGDRSTFDDFDWDVDISDKNGLGSSFCMRVLLQEEPLKKQIYRNFDYYLKKVGGEEKIKYIGLNYKDHSILREKLDSSI